MFHLLPIHFFFALPLPNPRPDSSGGAFREGPSGGAQRGPAAVPSDVLRWRPLGAAGRAVVPFVVDLTEAVGTAVHATPGGGARGSPGPDPAPVRSRFALIVQESLVKMADIHQRLPRNGDQLHQRHLDEFASYAGALFDVSAGEGEDVASSCAGFKDLSHWLKIKTQSIARRKNNLR